MHKQELQLHVFLCFLTEPPCTFRLYIGVNGYVVESLGCIIILNDKEIKVNYENSYIHCIESNNFNILDKKALNTLLSIVRGRMYHLKVPTKSLKVFRLQIFNNIKFLTLTSKQSWFIWCSWCCHSTINFLNKFKLVSIFNTTVEYLKRNRESLNTHLNSNLFQMHLLLEYFT